MSGPGDHLHPQHRMVSAIQRACFVIWRVLCTSISSIVTSFLHMAYQYVLLLALWRLKSFSKPLDSLATEIIRPWGTQDVHTSWRVYLRSVEKDLEVWAAVCGQILTLTIGLLAVASIVQDNLTQTIALACIVTCGAGAAMSFNMKRHINHILQYRYAHRNWVLLAEKNQYSRLVAVPLLLAGPSAWCAWSAILFVALLQSYVCAAGKLGTRLSSSSDTIISLTWSSITILSLLFLVVSMHVAVHAYYFTKLGMPSEDDTGIAGPSLSTGSTSTLPTRMLSYSENIYSAESPAVLTQYAVTGGDTNCLDSDKVGDSQWYNNPSDQNCRIIVTAKAYPKLAT